MNKIFFYAYPINKFERNADTNDIISAYERDDNNSLQFPVLKLTPDELAEKMNDEMFNDQEYWIRAVKEENLSKDQLAEQLREEIIQEIICLLKREGIDSLTFSECMEDYASTIWFDRHDFPCWSRITGIKIVDTGLMIHCGDEDISIYTDSDYGARNISTLCDILYVVKETIEQTPVLKSCKIMGEYLNSKGQGTIEFCDEPALFLEGQRKIIRQFSINEQGNLIGIKTDEQGYCFDLTPTKDNTPAFLENMLRETGMEDLLGHAFYKVNDNQEAIFEYFINQKLSEQ